MANDPSAEELLHQIFGEQPSAVDVHDEDDWLDYLGKATG